MNAIDDIQAKYMTALSEITADGGWVEWPAVRLALRLAIADGVTVGRTIAGHEAAALGEKLERRQSMLLDLQAALDAALADAAAVREERDSLRQQLAQMDADNADLTQQLKNKDVYIAAINNRMVEALAAADKAREASVALQAEIDRLTRQNTIAVDTFNSLAEHTNGNGAALNAGWRDVLTDLTAAQLDFVESLDAGRRRFRDVPKRDRLSIIQSILRHIQRATGAEATPAMSAYDQARPAWAPQASGIPVVFGCSWLELPTLDPLDVAV